MESDLRRSLPPLMRPRLGSGVSAAAVLGWAMLLNQLDRVRSNSAVQEAVKRFGLDPAARADVAGAQAYVWARHFGPLSFDVPWSGKALDRFAEAVMRAERASPGTLARALGGERPAQAVLDRLARAKEAGATPAPAARHGTAAGSRRGRRSSATWLPPCGRRARARRRSRARSRTCVASGVGRVRARSGCDSRIGARRCRRRGMASWAASRLASRGATCRRRL